MLGLKNSMHVLSRSVRQVRTSNAFISTLVSTYTRVSNRVPRNPFVLNFILDLQMSPSVARRSVRPRVLNSRCTPPLPGQLTVTSNSPARQPGHDFVK